MRKRLRGLNRPGAGKRRSRHLSAETGATGVSGSGWNHGGSRSSAFPGMKFKETRGASPFQREPSPCCCCCCCCCCRRRRCCCLWGRLRQKKEKPGNRGGGMWLSVMLSRRVQSKRTERRTRKRSRWHRRSGKSRNHLRSLPSRVSHSPSI